MEKPLIKAIIVEDEMMGYQALHNALNKFCPHVTVEKVAHSIESAYPILSDPEQDIDVVFLDINLSDGQAFTLLNRIPERNYDIIFTSGHVEFAIEANWFNALAFLTKPIDADLLQLAVNKVKPRKERKTAIQTPPFVPGKRIDPKQNMMLTTVESTHVIPYGNILYLKGNGSYTDFHFLNTEEPIVISQNIGHYEEELKNADFFFRVHRSYVINLIHVVKLVERIENGAVILKGDVSIPVSRHRWEQFKEKLTSWRNNY
jgi:two-component system, LytTR family, response regulator